MAKFVRDTYSAFHLAEEITFAPISGVEHLFAGLEDPLSSPPTSLPPSDSSQGRRGKRYPLFQPDPLVDPPPLLSDRQLPLFLRHPDLAHELTLP